MRAAFENTGEIFNSNIYHRLKEGTKVQDSRYEGYGEGIVIRIAERDEPGKLVVTTVSFSNDPYNNSFTLSYSGRSDYINLDIITPPMSDEELLLTQQRLKQFLSSLDCE